MQGATVKEVGKEIVISRVLCGGAADRSGMLHPGDVVHEINGEDIGGRSVDYVAEKMVPSSYNAYYYNNYTVS